jgi:hypothetical protein
VDKLQHVTACLLATVFAYSFSGHITALPERQLPVAILIALALGFFKEVGDHLQVRGARGPPHGPAPLARSTCRSAPPSCSRPPRRCPAPTVATALAAPAAPPPTSHLRPYTRLPRTAAPLQLWNGVFSLGDLGADLLGALIAGAVILGVQYHDARQQQRWLAEQGDQADVEKPKEPPAANQAAMRRSRSGLLKY